LLSTVVRYRMEIMKISDDYKAKLRLWAHNPRVSGVGSIADLPHFTCVRFSSYQEMNEWKKEYIRSLARSGGCQWKKS